VECLRIDYYGDRFVCQDGRCVEGTACETGTAGCACSSEGACTGELVCDDDTTTCRQPVACAQAGCVAHQVCAPPSAGTDAECLTECEAGYRWNSTSETCEAVTCGAGDVGTEGCACTNLGACYGGLVCDAETTTCRQPRGCTPASCEEHQVCAEPSAGNDAECLAECESGYQWNPTLHTCDANPCSELDCAAQNRACEVDTSDQASCTDCLVGYIEDDSSSACRLPHGCSDIGCDVASCIAPAGEDARCIGTGQDVCEAVGTGVCPAGQAWRPGIGAVAGSCISCAACPLGEGYTGQLYPVATNDGKCVCVPETGWFFASGGSLQNKRCDADGDGWVRGSARQSLRSEDCAIVNNALCNVHRIDRFELIGDDESSGVEWVQSVSDDTAVSGLPVVLELGGILELYEADANDDFGLRSNGTDYPVVNPYNPTGSSLTTRAFQARELNSLTKACAPASNSDPSVDYNANLIPDIEEWHGMPAQSQVPDWLQPFVHYSYFLELYEGHYVDSSPTGAYRLVEKARDSSTWSALQVPLVMDEGDAYWKSCWRRTDASYVEPGVGTPPTIGMDFARFNQQANGYGVPIFGHSSQFKCLDIVANSVPIDSPALTPHRIHVSDADAQYQVNACRVRTEDPSGDSQALGDQTVDNPHAPVLACQSTSGFEGVALAVHRYEDYSATGDYVRGCINECVDHAYLAPAEQCDDWQRPTFSCSADAATGRLTECLYDAGCADCTWDGTAWTCAPRSSTVCGNCGTCTEKSSNPPSWTCDRTATNCTGDCSECYEQSAGFFQCRAEPNTPCGAQCGVCEGSGSYFACQYYNSMCDADGCDPWGVCDYLDVCDESAQQTRTCRDYSCSSGTCTVVTTPETRACTRDTDDEQCGSLVPTCGSWGVCGGFSSTCDRTGTQTRTCTADLCVAGACDYGHTWTETQSCYHETNGDGCRYVPCDPGCTGTGHYTCCSGGLCNVPCGGNGCLCP
jgi:hypothetical protein